MGVAEHLRTGHPSRFYIGVQFYKATPKGLKTAVKRLARIRELSGCPCSPAFSVLHLISRNGLELSGRFDAEPFISDNCCELRLEKRGGEGDIDEAGPCYVC